MRDAAVFIEQQEPSARRKILYNMTKAQVARLNYLEGKNE
jgi:hypothetical protein